MNMYLNRIDLRERRVMFRIEREISDDRYVPRGFWSMSEIVVKVRIPYSQSYIPWRHKKPQQEYIWSEGFITIKEVVAEAAPVSHRILGKDGTLEAEVRQFGDGYWWALMNGHRAATMAELGNEWRKVGRPITMAEFMSAAEQKNDNLFWAALGCFRPVDEPISEDEFFAKKPRLLKSTHREQWARANLGASRMIHCDGLVLVEAGPPMYYGVQSWTLGGLDIVAGPSSLDRAYGAYRLHGPDRPTRTGSAAEGLAFGTREFRREKRLLRLRWDRVRDLCRLEGFASRQDLELGPVTCARALVNKLWDRSKDNYAGWWSPLRERMPSFAEATQPAKRVETLPYRRVLEEFVAVDWTDTTNEKLTWMLGDAREILRRLDLMDAARLADEDDAAISGLQP
jgi:hypothetical protein